MLIIKKDDNLNDNKSSGDLFTQNKSTNLFNNNNTANSNLFKNQNTSSLFNNNSKIGEKSLFPQNNTQEN